MSDAAGFVLDASGLLAYLLAEPGGDVVRDTFAEQAAVISAVNWAEVLTRLPRPAQISPILTTDPERAKLQIDVEVRLARP